MTNNDIDFETAARCVARYETLRKAVRTRKYTDRPGADWHLSSCAELPEYYYGRNKVMISSTEDGNAFEVLVFNRGRQVHSKAYKTVDAAFRNGEKFANVEYPEPTAEVVEVAPVVEEAAPVVEDEQPAEEPAVERYERMSLALTTLKRIDPDERTAEQREEIRTLNADLTELLSIPPAGYSVPKAVTDLLAFAEAHGWRTSALWTAPGYEGEPFLNVQIGRLVPADEREDYRGDRWVYSLTWHSRDCAPGKVRRFGQGTAVTPDNPATHGAPSVKAIRAVIAENAESPVSVAA